MTLPELAQKLLTLGYPVAYSHFASTQTPPFICYLVVDSDTFSADDKPIHESIDVDIELYVKSKSLAIENQIKDLLTENELSWTYNEIWLKDEGVFQCTFSIQILTGE